jgi:two-component system, OmpR family, KDP operon response regulator KdpE
VFGQDANVNSPLEGVAQGKHLSGGGLDEKHCAEKMDHEEWASDMRLSTTSATILVVADDVLVRRALWTVLSSEGCSMVEAKSGGEALAKLRNERPDLILLDLSSEPRDLACREIRSVTDVPMIVLMLQNSEQEKVVTLDAGADDCMLKPFSVQELLARVRALLRRVGPTENPRTFESGDLKIDFDRRMVSVRGAKIRLTPKEFELLRFLVANKGKALRHRRLLQAILGAPFSRCAKTLRWKTRGVFVTMSPLAHWLPA